MARVVGTRDELARTERSAIILRGWAVERPHSTPRPDELSFRHAPILNRIGKHRASEPKRSRLGRAWLFGVLLVTALLSIKFLPTGTPNRTGEPPLAPASSTAPAAEGVMVDRVAIERVPIGHRALGRNPLRDQVDLDLPDPDPATWRLVRLQMIKANGYPLDIELLRPLDYLDLIGATPGGTIDLDLAEMGACGPAEVLSIGPCPPIPPGRGAVITGRFVHELSPDDKLVDVHIDGLPDPIGCTPNHLFWSETRLNFIPAADLQPGEQLLTATLGPVQVASSTPRPWEQFVYNLEVHAEHVYQVGELGTLVHNKYVPKSVRWGDRHYNVHNRVVNSLDHVWMRHGFGSSYPNVSRFSSEFSTKFKLKGLITEALRKGDILSSVKTAGGGHEIVIQMKRVVGVGRSGNTTSRLRMFIDSNDVMHTVFPD
jgi:hypothetical protein